MKLVHVITRTETDAPPDKADRLLAGGAWVPAVKARNYEKAAPVLTEVPVLEPEGDDTQDEVSDAPGPSEGQDDGSEEILVNEEARTAAPSIPEMRKWALENNIEGVKAKGKLSKEAIDAYMEAHQD